jgi:hypothetical protein
MLSGNEILRLDPFKTPRDFTDFTPQNRGRANAGNEKNYLVPQAEGVQA